MSDQSALKKGKGFISEFKEFINRGSVLDLAVGVIIGAAFQAIINSLVNDLVMPLISVITGGINFTDWAIRLGSAETSPMLTYGNFITAVINFLLMAFVVFLVVKGMNKLSRKKEAAPSQKTCPYCKTSIAVDATRCPNCTSQLS
ncbi:MAG: large conductance mechanosensitive channel protein MscL [Lachnospiraceae bacterium]